MASPARMADSVNVEYRQSRVRAHCRRSSAAALSGRLYSHCSGSSGTGVGGDVDSKD